MSKWLTPEEISRKRDFRQKKIYYVLIPLIGVILGAVIGISSHFL